MDDCCLTTCDNDAELEVTFPDTGDTYRYCRRHAWPYYRSAVVTPIRRNRR